MARRERGTAARVWSEQAEAFTAHPTAYKPADGTRVPFFRNRAFVMANESTFLRYHAERRDIEKRFPLLFPDFTDEERETMRGLRAYALEELRTMVRTEVTTLDYAGPYLIPV